jgi:hypothetical protein
MGDLNLKLPCQSTLCEGVIAVDAATAVARTINDWSARSFKISRNHKNPLSRTIIAQIGDALKFLNVSRESHTSAPRWRSVLPLTAMSRSRNDACKAGKPRVVFVTPGT